MNRKKLFFIGGGAHRLGTTIRKGVQGTHPLGYLVGEPALLEQLCLIARGQRVPVVTLEILEQPHEAVPRLWIDLRRLQGRSGHQQRQDERAHGRS